MARKRPCRFCRRWFRPDPRLGTRQYACSRAECQRERHRRNCAAHRLRDPDFTRREEQVRSRVTQGPAASWSDKHLEWEAVRTITGTDGMVVLQEVGRDIERRVRDLLRREFRVVAGRSAQVTPPGLRDSSRQETRVVAGRSAQDTPGSLRDSIGATPPPS